MNISVVYPGEHTNYDKLATGTPMSIVDIKDVLDLCTTLPLYNTDGTIRAKHKDGVIFPIVKNTLGSASEDYYDRLVCDGVVLIDIDHITTEQADCIYDNFEKLCLNFLPLYAIQRSSSYFIRKNSDDVGLHLYIHTPKGNGWDYRYYSKLCLYYIPAVILTVTGINLYERNKKIKVLDPALCVPGQRFFLYHSPYKTNSVNFVPERSFFNRMQQEMQSSSLVRKYICDLAINPGEGTSPFVYTNIENDKHIDYKLVGISEPINNIKHLGRAQRWYLYCALISVFGEKQRVDAEFARCMKLMEIGGHSTEYYIKEGATSDWFKSYKAKSYNTDILSQFGYNVEQLVKTNGQLELQKGQYLSDIQDQIEHLIEQNDYRCEIIAPTGTGKTVLINGPTEKSTITDVGTSLCAIFEQKKETTGIAEKYNAVVVVPYNMTNGLYNNLTCISSDNGLTKKENESLIKKGNPLVMVFDQFLIYKDLLIDRTIILDEAHTIFTDKTYRTSVVKFADFVVKNNMKIIAFTATPEIEADILKIKQFTVSAYQKPINMQIVNFEPYEIDNQTVNPNTFNFEVKLADRLKTGEQMIFFDNKNSRNLADYIKSTKSADAVTVVRADTKENDKVKRLRENEIIETQFLVSTKAGFQGLNYKNENRITAVINFEYMSSYKSDIFQTIGRFRKSNDINVIVLYSKKDVSTVQEKIDLTNEKNKVYDDIGATQFNNVDQSVLDPDQQKIMLEMEQYFMENSTYESVLSEIKKHQNIRVKEKQYSCSNKRYDNKEKRSESDKFIEGIKNNNWNRITGNVFWDKNVEMMRELELENIQTDMILDIVNTKKKNVLFETIAEELLTIINIANRGTVEEIQEFEGKLEKWVTDNKRKNVDVQLYKYFKRQLVLVKKTIKIKKQMIEQNKNVNDFISAVLDEFLYEQSTVCSKESDAGKVGGKIGGKIGGKNGSPRKRVKDLKTNKIYESLTDFAAAYGKSSSWASKHKTNWITID